MVKYIPYILYLLLIGLHQVILKDWTQIYATSINLPLMIVLCVSLYKTEITTSWFAFLAGIVISAGNHEMIGWQALLVTVIAISSFNICTHLNLESIFSKVLVIASGVFIHNVITLMMGGFDNFLIRAWSVALLGSIYTSLLAWLFFLFKDEKITYKKFKEIF
ncbi:MAG: hypothetical protein DRP35_03840 [Candidatus Zixiibacteriota bacterium]|nr:MAG: hypothetical protein DRP35_03840 [candidate division Zixibacteria bacterium]